MSIHGNSSTANRTHAYPAGFPGRLWLRIHPASPRAAVRGNCLPARSGGSPTLGGCHPSRPGLPNSSAIPGAHSPLEELIRKARQKEDDYPSEKYGREIESHFARWAVELLQKKDDLRARAAFLSPQLTAASPGPQGFDRIREDSILVVRRASFSSELSLGRDAFLGEFRSSLGLISEFLVAEFTVADLEVASASPLRITTQVRYVLVGTRARLHRLQLNSGGHPLRPLRWIGPRTALFLEPVKQDAIAHAGRISRPGSLKGHESPICRNHRV